MSTKWAWWKVQPCGTPAAYRRHLRAGESCPTCRDAYARHMRDYRAKKALTP